MAVTKTTTTGYGTRVKNSFGGILSGIMLFVIGTGLLWWNEGRTVKTAKMLEEAEACAIHVDDVSKVDPSLTGQLIHATAMSATTEVLQDPDFGISLNAVKISRNVEYYQYKEQASTKSEDKLGGKQVNTTTYTYSKGWTSSEVESENFEDPEYRGKNFALMSFEDKESVASDVSFGGYKLSESLIRGISGSVAMELNIDESFLKAWNADIQRKVETPEAIAAAKAAEELAKKTEVAKDTTANDSNAVKTPETINDNRYAYVHVSNNVVYFGKNPNSPQIGDVRVTFSQVNAGLVSVLAQVNGNTFEPFTAKNGKTLSTIRMGKVDMEKIFQQENETNNTWKWVLRILGIVLVCSGLKGIFAFLSTILKVVPFLASIMNWGVSIICYVIGIAWSLIIIAIAWIFYRPILGISLLAIAAAIIGFFVYKGKSKKSVVEPEPVAEA